MDYCSSKSRIYFICQFKLNVNKVENNVLFRNHSIFFFGARLVASMAVLKIQMMPVAAENERNIPAVYNEKNAT